ncbi:MAG: hypothetical protein AMJ79_05790 [Phycisphaerae bacterium SM23_30]|nr:MAG: hypothetical protein AMJ79_05790 [Phycisphaerae bacterium SM23_30]
MSETRRNLLVAAFVLLGLTGLGWLVIKFGDLPSLVHRVDAHEITIMFPEAPAIQENTEVLFLGYPVGRVVSIEPPRLLQDLDNPILQYYQVAVVVSVHTEYEIPNNAVPKIYRRGLGSSFLEFDLAGPVSAKPFADGDKIKGVVSTASEFVSENTQRQLDELIASLTGLSDQLKFQLTPLPPEQVDQAEPQKVQANITTAVMRLDTALKNFNVIIGDVENQQNVKKGLAEFTELVGEMRQGVGQMQGFTAEAVKLIEQTSQTVGNMDNLAGEVNRTVQAVAPRIQNAADETAASLNHLTMVLEGLTAGEGTAGRMLHDPRLYESLVDAVENINLTMTEFGSLIALLKEYGIWYKGK